LLLLFLDLAFAGLDTPLPLPSQDISSRHQEDRHHPQGALPLLETTPPPRTHLGPCP
jgi:hypothetical protein